LARGNAINQIRAAINKKGILDWFLAVFSGIEGPDSPVG